jgi:hypothetical protein
MASPVQARVQQLLSMGSAEPVLPNQQPGIAPQTPSPAFAPPPAAAAPATPPPASATPAPGATRVFANGNIGRWDGTGWVHLNPPGGNPS